MPITDNNGSEYYNLNISRSFLQTFTTALAPLSAFLASEVLIVNRGSSPVNIYDNNAFSDLNLFALSAGESFVFKGISNSNSISAKTLAGSTILNYRVSRFNSTNQ